MKTKFIFIMGLALLSSYSCQKSKLYPALPTSVSNQSGAPFSTSARISSQVLGLYSSLKSGNLYGGRYQIYNDVKADNWINATANSVTAYQTWTESVSPTSSEVASLWTQCYATINDCNLFIDGMKTYGTPVVGTALAANYIGEAKFVRALSYYALLQMYCQAYSVNAGATPGVPLRLTGNSAYGNYALAPATVAQVYAQVISDLNAAETALPLAYYTSGTTLDPVSNTTRAHVNSAIAVKTRVYLAMGQYANVVTEANKIVSGTAPFTAPTGVPFALQANIANVFKSPYATTESVFSAPFSNASTVDQPGGQSALADYYNSTGTGEFYLNTSSALFTDPTWKATDARRGFIAVVSGKSRLTKWPLGAPYLDWANIMRYSEVLLNLAEARVNLNGPTDPQAIALLNAVRQRSDPSTVFVTATLPSIYEERNIEFLGEGLRWADLLRLGLPIPAKGSVAAIAVGGFNSSYIWPMSGPEQSTNPLIGR
ncbi:MAG TPA: RagB/SusD family nutrient uptake outer membrane protein [Mucilaginibacter sp.]|nr:RagB/SusD family nutrient uptake outer membrane protein [Mucilaginibacter sp.]